MTETKKHIAYKNAYSVAYFRLSDAGFFKHV